MAELPSRLPTRPHWTPRVKILVSMLLLAGAVYLLYRFSVVLAPFTLAVIVAYVLSPLVNRLQERLKIRRGLAVLLAYLVMLLILVLIPVVVVPPLVNQATALNLDIQRLLLELEALLGKQYVIAGQMVNIDLVFQQAITSLQGLVEPFFTQTFGLVVEVISSLVWVIFVVVISFYLIKDAQALRRWIEELVPPSYRPDFLILRGEINAIWNAFFRGQLVLATVVALLFTAAGFLLGLPFALAMGVLAGLLEFLPSIGHGIWLAIAATLAFFLGSTWLPLYHWAFMLLIISLHLVYQQFDLNYLIPRIIGRRVHLAPVVVILGIVTGAVLAGVLGVVLAAPTIASIRIIGRYIYANLFDLDPFPPAEFIPSGAPQAARTTLSETVIEREP